MILTAAPCVASLIKLVKRTHYLVEIVRIVSGCNVQYFHGLVVVFVFLNTFMLFIIKESGLFEVGRVITGMAGIRRH
jgi:hypothetical protein